MGLSDITETLTERMKLGVAKAGGVPPGPLTDAVEFVGEVAAVVAPVADLRLGDAGAVAAAELSRRARCQSAQQAWQTRHTRANHNTGGPTDSCS